MPPADPEVVSEGVSDSPESQVPHNDHTTDPINTNGPIVADEFSVCEASSGFYEFPYTHSANRMKVVSLEATNLILPLCRQAYLNTNMKMVGGTTATGL